MDEGLLVQHQMECTDCGTHVPVTQLRASYDRGGGTSLRCSKCQHKHELKTKLQDLKPITARAGQLQREHDEEVVGELVRKLNAPHVSEISDEFNNQIEMEQLVRFYLNQMSLAAAFKPGSKIVLEFLKGILNIHVQSTQYRETAPDVEKMSDEQLERELNERMAAMLADKLADHKKKRDVEKKLEQKLIRQEAQGCADDEDEDEQEPEDDDDLDDEVDWED